MSVSQSSPMVNYADTQFDPNSLYNIIPSIVPGLQHWDPNYTVASTTAAHLSYTTASVDPMSWVGWFGEEYSQFFNQSYTVTPWRERSLSQEEQSELMDLLVKNPPDVSHFVDDSATFYNSSIL